MGQKDITDQTIGYQSQEHIVRKEFNKSSIFAVSGVDTWYKVFDIDNTGMNYRFDFFNIHFSTEAWEGNWIVFSRTGSGGASPLIVENYLKYYTGYQPGPQDCRIIQNGNLSSGYIQLRVNDGGMYRLQSASSGYTVYSTAATFHSPMIEEDPIAGSLLATTRTAY